MRKCFALFLCLFWGGMLSNSLLAQYQFMPGGFDAAGKPLYLLPNRDQISAEFRNKIAINLPESRPVPVYQPSWIASGRTETLGLNCSSDVWVTFVDEGASYRNVLGYYTFNTANPPTVAPSPAQITVIFPNASKQGFGGELVPGDKVYLGRFPAGTGIGFVLLADGWNGSSVGSGNWTLYSNNRFNPESDTSLRRHTVMLRDTASNRIVFGFEDIRRDINVCDQDFNDLLFFATITPFECLDTQSVPKFDPDGDEAYSGQTGGLESKSLGDKITQRIFQQIRSGQNGPVQYSRLPLLESSTGQIRSQATASTRISLDGLLPTSIPDSGFKAYVSTPSDIVALTNAKTVRSVDFTRNGQCRAVAFGVQTLGEMYEHTKPMCDRMKGATLLSTEYFQLEGYDFVRYALQQEKGNIEYAMSFSIGQKAGRNHFSFQSHWLNANYQAEDTMFHFQVWAAAPYLCTDMALDILKRLKSRQPVVQLNKATALPQAYVVKGKRDGLSLQMTVQNTTAATQAFFEIIERSNEKAQQKTKRTASLSLAAGKTSALVLPVSDAYESTISLYVNGQLQDVVYMSDGAWGLNYDSTQTTIQQYSISNDSTVGMKDDYRLFRNVQLKANSSNYVTAFRVLRGAGVEQDLRDFKSLRFQAKGEAQLRITLVKNSITDFEKQFKYLVQLSKDNKTYQVNLADFKQAGSNATLSANDLTVAVFSFESRDGKTLNLDGALSQVAFSKTDAMPAAPENTAGEIQVYPNPIKGNHFTAEITSPIATQLTLRLTDAASGKVLFSKDIAVAQGKNNVPIECNMGSALRVLLLTASGKGIQVQPKKLVVQP